MEQKYGLAPVSGIVVGLENIIEKIDNKKQEKKKKRNVKGTEMRRKDISPCSKGRPNPKNTAHTIVHCYLPWEYLWRLFYEKGKYRAMNLWLEGWESDR